MSDMLPIVAAALVDKVRDAFLIRCIGFKLTS